MRHYRVRDVMTTGHVTVTPATSLKDVVDILVEHKLSALPVLTLRGRLAGVVAESDLLKKEQLQSDPDGPHAMHMPYRARRALVTAETAGEIMSTHPVTVRGDATTVEAARLMDRHRVGCLMVTDENQNLLGVVNSLDLLRVFLRPDNAEAELGYPIDDTGPHTPFQDPTNPGRSAPASRRRDRAGR